MFLKSFTSKRMKAFVIPLSSGPESLKMLCFTVENNATSGKEGLTTLYFSIIFIYEHIK